jgi:O-antigen/teichoic acid export membrane protein
MYSLFSNKTFKASYSILTCFVYFLLTTFEMILITKISGLQGVGDYGVAYTTALLGSLLALFGMDRYLAKQLSSFLEKHEQEQAMRLFGTVLRKVLFFSFSIACALPLVLFGFSFLNPDLFLHPVWFAAFLIPPMAGARIVVRALDVLNKFILETTVYRILLNLTTMSFILFLYIFSIKWPISKIILCIALIWLIFFVILCINLPKGWIDKILPSDLTVSFFGINVLFWFYQMINMALDRIGLICLDAFNVDESLVGVMANVIFLIRISHLLFFIHMSIVLQQFAQSKIRQDPSLAQQTLSFYSRFVFLVNIALMLIFCFFGSQILSLFDPAAAQYKLVLVLVFAGVFMQLAVGYAWYYVLLSEEKRFTYLFLSVQAALVLFLNIALIPSYHIMGAAIAFLIPVGLGTVIFYLYFRKKYGFTLLGKIL